MCSSPTVAFATEVRPTKGTGGYSRNVSRATAVAYGKIPPARNPRMPYPSSHRTPELHRKVSFQFTKKELRIVESFSGFASDNETIKSTPLNVQTPIKFVWPQDADVHVAELALTKSC